MKTATNRFMGRIFAGLVVFAVAGSVSASVIYSDSFDRITGSGDANGNPAGAGNGFSDWGQNDNAFGGTVVNSWLAGPAGRAGGANQTTDGDLASTIEGGVHYVFDVTTVAPLGFKVEFDFNRFHPVNAGPGNGLVSIGLGAPTGAAIGGGQFAVANSDFAIVFQQGVGANVGNTTFHEDGVFLPGTGSEGPVDYGDPNAWHSVDLRMIPAVAGAYGDSDVINGSLRIDGGAAYNFTVLGGDEFGNLAFASNGFVHRAYDNLIVTAIPEPGTLSLLLLSGLGILVRRRFV